MSRLNRSQDRQRSSFGPYITETTANISPTTNCSSLNSRYISIPPKIHLRGSNGNESIERHPDYNDIERLEDLEDPNFCDLPVDSSLDELRCIMATPPQVIPAAPNDPKDIEAIIRRRQAIARLNELKEKSVLEDAKRRGEKGFLPKSKVVTSNLKKQVIRKFSEPIPPTKLIKTGKARLKEWKQDLLAPLPINESEELDEFEALEELYGAVRSDQHPSTRQSTANLQKQINVLQEQFLKSPAAADSMLEFKALEQELGAAPSFEQPIPENFGSNLKDRINSLKERIFPSTIGGQGHVYELPSVHHYEDLQQSREAMTAEATEIRQMRRTQLGSPYEFHTKSRTSTIANQKSNSPRFYTSRTKPHAQKFVDSIVQNIDMTEFDVNEIPKFAFSTDALADAGFEIGDDTLLGEISMPDFNEDISFNEVAIADITSPDLCDLSISRDKLALEPDFPIEILMLEGINDHNTEKGKEKLQEQQGILPSVVRSIVECFKDISSPSRTLDIQNLEEISDLELDTSLPNIFKRTPQATAGIENPALQQPVTTNAPFVIPPHPKDPNDYRTMIKRAQAIREKEMEELAADKASSSFNKKNKKQKKEIPSKLTTKKKVPMLKERKADNTGKVYPPGEYSPSYEQAVAEARSLYGLRNLSTILNPESAAIIIKQKAARKAKLAAMEALPPVERLRKKIKLIKRGKAMIKEKEGDILAPLPLNESEELDEFEALEELYGAFRSDQHPFTRQRTANLQNQINVLQEQLLKSPAAAESMLEFMALEQEFGAAPYFEQPIPENFESNLQDRINSLKERIFQSTIGSQGHVFELPSLHHYKERGKTLSEEHAIPENLDDIEYPAFLDLSDMLAPKDLSVSTPNEIVCKNRPKRKNKFSYASPDIREYTKSIPFPKTIYLPQNLPNEDIFNIETPEFERTLQTASPHESSFSSIEKDHRMYAWGAHPSASNLSKNPTIYPVPLKLVKQTRPMHKINKADTIVHIPSQPKDHKNYKAMIKRAKDIQKLLKLQESNATEANLPIQLQNLLEQSASSIAQTPLNTSSKKYNRPTFSFPMVWGDTQPPTSGTSKNLTIPTPIKSQNPPPLQEVIDRKTSTPIGQIVIPPHPKNPKDYAGIIRRARAIYKLNNQKETENTPLEKPQSKTSRNGRLHRKNAPKPKRKLLKVEEKKIMECTTKPPQLPQDYVNAVAKARLLRGLENKIAALSPKISSQKAAQKTALEALPEIEKIKWYVKELRKHPQCRRRIKPTIEHIAYLEALKQINDYHTSFSPEPLSRNRTQLPLSISITPRADLIKISDDEFSALAEFEALEKLSKAASSPIKSTQGLNLKQRITELKPLMENNDISQHQDVSLPEYEALKGSKTPIQQNAQHIGPLNIKELISELRNKQLETPPDIKPEERFRQLMAQKKTQPIPVASPIKTPEVRYTPITLISSPDKKERKKLEQISKSQTRERTANGTKKPEKLEDIQEPNYLDIMFSRSAGQLRPRNMEKVYEQVRERYKNVPSSPLLEPRTPPRILPLITEFPDEELENVSCPELERTSRSPVHSPTRSHLRTNDILIPRHTEQNTSIESPRARYERIIAERRIVPFTIPYSPIYFVNPSSGKAQTGLEEAIKQQKLDYKAFQNLEELDRISQIEQPSFQVTDNEYFSPTPPHTPPPAPSHIINRIREKYKKRKCENF